MHHPSKEFPIISLTREDLEVAGLNSKGVSDEIMSRLASKMADAFCEDFLDTLVMLAERYDIPQRSMPVTEAEAPVLTT